MEALLDMESLKKYTPEQQQQILAGIRQQTALASAQNIITALSDKCTTKCITTPGATLSGSEKQCVQRCMDRFIESWNVVSTTLAQRLQQESMKQGGSPSASLPTGLFGGAQGDTSGGGYGFS